MEDWEAMREGSKWTWVGKVLAQYGNSESEEN
jgi:hypothetical protein